MKVFTTEIGTILTEKRVYLTGAKSTKAPVRYLHEQSFPPKKFIDYGKLIEERNKRVAQIFRQKELKGMGKRKVRELILGVTGREDLIQLLTDLGHIK